MGIRALGKYRDCPARGKRAFGKYRDCPAWGRGTYGNIGTVLHRD